MFNVRIHHVPYSLFDIQRNYVPYTDILRLAHFQALPHTYTMSTKVVRKIANDDDTPIIITGKILYTAIV